MYLCVAGHDREACFTDCELNQSAGRLFSLFSSVSASLTCFVSNPQASQMSEDREFALLLHNEEFLLQVRPKMHFNDNSHCELCYLRQYIYILYWMITPRRHATTRSLCGPSTRRSGVGSSRAHRSLTVGKTNLRITNVIICRFPHAMIIKTDMYCN